MQTHQPYKGFTLIEVLVAVVIFSIGMLGLANLQLTSYQRTHSAHLRSVATTLAYDMADRMRANQVAVRSGNYDLPGANAVTGCTTVTGCTPAEMARNDAQQWNQALADNLPQGQGVVCLDDSPNDGSDPTNHGCNGNGNVSVIKVWWIDDRNVDGGGNPVPQRFITSFRP